MYRHAQRTIWILVIAATVLFCLAQGGATWRGLKNWSLSISFSTMPYFENGNFLILVIDSIKDAIISFAQAVVILGTFKLFKVYWPGIVFKLVNFGDNGRNFRFRKGANVLLGRFDNEQFIQGLLSPVRLRIGRKGFVHHWSVPLYSESLQNLQGVQGVFDIDEYRE